ncbi:TraX family protein [Denitromonas iodatirespirans]|uniref:Conjugal transfer protein TraX n=1 Tax=Denitromonas iodatirespirans TaxID=2795389 RepID=A0A944HA06_DENI1|nr:TraX family protein [Denitromonas iodatirespirans]MBT0962995.1 hypothetical protein [Denitromonas iodatirespirans]
MTSSVVAATPASWTVKSGTLEVLKWIGVVSMLADHVNYAFDIQSIAALSFGRLAFPLFAFVFAYNLAAGDSSRMRRGMRRMMIAGVLSQLPYYLIFHDPLRLNIFFTFLLAAMIIQVNPSKGTKERVTAVGLWLFGGFFVDYYHPGVAAVLAMYYALQPHRAHLECVSAMSSAFFVLSGFLINLVGWPGIAVLLAWPCIIVTRAIEPSLARSPRAFYVIYPVHLALIATTATYLK